MENKNLKQIASAIKDAVTLLEYDFGNGAQVAKLYTEMTDIEQAVFWHTVAEEFEKFNGCLQNCQIASFMTPKAKAYIENLYKHTQGE